MSELEGRDSAWASDVLDWLHDQARLRRDGAPEFDAEKTLRLLHAVRDAAARDDSVTFWTALGSVGWCDIVSASHKQMFPAGTVLMREGEPADTVMVILVGRVRVSVEDRGLDRVMAERGPGDLVGEHGAAPGGVRSATVTAVEPVLALVMETEDFTAFINDHPDVPDLVKQQVYDRHTDPSSGPP
jgi:Cyclic nucleotide-binding domain